MNRENIWRKSWLKSRTNTLVDHLDNGIILIMKYSCKIVENFGSAICDLTMRFICYRSSNILVQWLKVGKIMTLKWTKTRIYHSSLSIFTIQRSKVFHTNTNQHYCLQKEDERLQSELHSKPPNDVRFFA